jgi:tetratricopeptide (TPR) repeat protein
MLYRADGALAAAAHTGWRRWVTSWGVLAALVLGLASKETAFVTPGLLLLADWYDGRVTGIGWEGAIRRHWVLTAASVALTAEWLWVWLTVVGELAGGEAAPGMLGAGLGERAIVMAPIVLEYLRLLIVPIKLSADYSPDFLPVAEGLTPRGLLGVAIVVGGAVVALLARRRAPVVTVALAWVAGALLIVSNLLVVTEILLAERTLYLASAGAVLALGWLFQWGASRRLVPVALVAAVVVGLGLARTIVRVPVWRSNATIFPQLVEDAPGSFRSYWVAGGLALEHGDSARAEQLMRQALQIHPLHPSIWSDLAAQLERQGRWPEAARFFSVAHQLAPERGDYAALAIADYLRAGLVDSAAAVAARVEPPTTEDRQYVLATADIALARGRPLRAMFLRRRVALESPEVAVYWEITADAALRAGYCWQAERAVARIRAIDATRASLEEFARRLEVAGC